MKVTKGLKVLIGLLTLWVALSPFALMGLWLGLFLPMMILSDSQSSPDIGFLFLGPFLLFFVGILVTSVIQIALQVFYLIHIIRNSQASEIVRTVLGVGLFFLPFVAMPIYFLVCIRPENPPHWARAIPAIGPATST